MLPATTFVSKLKRLEETKKVIRCLLISMGSLDVTLPKLNREYKEIEDEDIPFREYNFTSLKDFLSSMPDVLELIYNKNNVLCAYHIDTENTQHITSLVHRQKKKSNSKTSKSVRHHNSIDPRLLNGVLQELKRSSTYRNNKKCISKKDILLKITNQIGDYAFYTVKDLNNQLNELTHLIMYDDDYIYLKTLSRNNQNKKEDEKTAKQKNSTSKNISSENRAESDAIDDLVRDSTKDRLQKLIKKNPEGIWCSELPDVYRREYGLNLEYSDLGFNSIIEFVAALPKIFKIVLPPNAKKQKVIDATICEQYFQNLYALKSTCLEPFENAEKEQEAIPTCLSPQVAKTLIPKGAMNFDDTIDQIHVINLSGKSDVIVSEVINPSFFWVILRKNGPKLTKMMNLLNEFYNQEDLHNYKIPKILLRPGLHIATPYCNLWHRGIIKETRPNKLVVLFYDYGTEEVYDSNKLYFLNKSFSALPAQAIPCSLYNVKPIRESWSSNIIQKFTTKVLERPFVANIHKVDEKANVIFIDLINVCNDECINDSMITKKEAVPGTSICKINNFTFEHHQCIQREQNNLLNTDSHRVHTIKKNRVDCENKDSHTICSQTNLTTQNYISAERKLEVIKKYKIRFSSSSESSSSMTSHSKDSISEEEHLKYNTSLNEQIIYPPSSDLDEDNLSSDQSLYQRSDSADFSDSFSSFSITSSTSESTDEEKNKKHFNTMFKC